MSNVGLFNIPTNCDFSLIFTEQQDETLGFVLIIGFIIIFSLIYIKNNKGAF